MCSDLASGELATAIHEVDADGPQALFCLEKYYSELVHRFEEDFDPASQADLLREDFAPPVGAFLVARTGGQLVGCGGLTTFSPGVGFITRMWVAPSARGCGLGHRILEALERCALVLGFGKVRLDTNKVLTEAQAMYRKEGYREIERFTHHPHAHLWFEKSLSDSGDG